MEIDIQFIDATSCRPVEGKYVDVWRMFSTKLAPLFLFHVLTAVIVQKLIPLEFTAASSTEKTAMGRPTQTT